MRGLQANNGNYFVLVDNTNHPNSLFNLNGDLQYLNLNANGFLLNPAKLLGQDGKRISCLDGKKNQLWNGAYILAANEDFGTGKNIWQFFLITMATQSGQEHRFQFKHRRSQLH